MGRKQDNAITTQMGGPRVVAFTVDGTGTAKLTGPDQALATLTDNGTGDYTLTWATALEQAAYVMAPIPITADVQPSLTANTTALVQFTWNSVETTPAATDCDFHVIMLIDAASGDYLKGV